MLASAQVVVAVVVQVAEDGAIDLVHPVLKYKNASRRTCVSLVVRQATGPVIVQHVRVRKTNRPEVWALASAEGLYSF